MGSLGELYKVAMFGSTPRVSDLISLECGLNTGGFENSEGDSNMKSGQEGNLIKCLHLPSRPL